MKPSLWRSSGTKVKRRMQTMKESLGTMALLFLLCPAWALAQTVYFNPDGSRYFHADSHCASISETYWAGMRETTEEEAMQRGRAGRAQNACRRERHRRLPVRQKQARRQAA